MKTIKVCCDIYKKIHLTSNRHSLANLYSIQCCILNANINSIILLKRRNMSQKSITSFFNVTPKANVKKNIKIIPDLLQNTQGSELTDGADHDNLKQPKRSRSISSDSNANGTPPVAGPAKKQKKKVKRQRIESSESEPDSTTDTIDVSIKFDNRDTETHNLPKIREIKSEKVDVDNKVKIEKKSPSPKKTPKKDAKASLSYFTIKKSSPGPASTDGVAKENGDHHKTVAVAEVDYNPNKAKYHPVDDACWARGQAVPYLALAKTLECIEATSARLKIIEILSNYLRSVIVLTPEDLLPSVYLCLNQLAPAYHSLELGIAETYLLKAVGQCTGRSLAQMRAAAQRDGDLGALAQAARAAQRTMFPAPPLTARKVLAALRDVARMAGQASVNKKIGKIQSLYVACRDCEARYLVRSLEGKLRIGLAEQSVLQALAQAFAAEEPGAASLPPDGFKALVEEFALLVKSAYCECPDYERVLGALLQHGVRRLPEHVRLTPGVPLKPMLAHPTRGVHEVFDRFEGETFTCEWKYDGERAQIHVPGDTEPLLQQAAIFSRNQENNTSKYPDVLERLPQLLKPSVTSCVLDCEAVAYDPATAQILPFQVLSTRKRKEAAASDVKVQVCVFLFDLLFLNGCALVRRPLDERRALLREHFNTVEGVWQRAEARDGGSEEELQRFLEEAVRGSCEGLMVKALRGERSRYDIARRSRNWLKLKKDYLEGAGDSIDAVVIGGYRGRGKRAGLYGGFLLACYDPAAESFQSLCKIGTGFSDDDLEALAAALERHVIAAPRSYYAFSAALAADVWFGAALVLEVRCADLSLSAAHRAALGLLHPERGVSLRFPRFVRLREDKAPEQATTPQQLARLYLAQDQVKNSAAAPLDCDDFY